MRSRFSINYILSTVKLQTLSISSERVTIEVDDATALNARGGSFKGFCLIQSVLLVGNVVLMVDSAARSIAATVDR